VNQESNITKKLTDEQVAGTEWAIVIRDERLCRKLKDELEQYHEYGDPSVGMDEFILKILNYWEGEFGTN